MHMLRSVQILFYITKYCFKVWVHDINALCITSNIRDPYTMKGREGQDGNGSEDSERRKLSRAVSPKTKYFRLGNFDIGRRRQLL